MGTRPRSPTQTSLFCLFGLLLVLLVASRVSSRGVNAGESADVDEHDDRTLLDTFGEATKQFLTTRVIPETNPECRWDWRFVRCEPYCECGFLPQVGDYHLGRACRILDKEGCDPTTVSREDLNTVQALVQGIVKNSQNVLRDARQRAKTGFEKIEGTVCADLSSTGCSEEPPVLAWQERLFCRRIVSECFND